MGGENFENTATVKEEGSVIATGGVVDDEAGEEEEERHPQRTQLHGNSLVEVDESLRALERVNW